MAAVITLHADGTLAAEGSPGVVTYITDEALQVVQKDAHPGALLSVDGTTYRLGYYRAKPNAHEIWEPATTPGVHPQA